MPDETPPVSTPATPAPAPAPAVVTIPAEQLTSLLALQAKVSQLETEQRTREQAAADERVRLQTEKGDAVKAVQTLREQKDAELQAERSKLTTTEDRAKRYALDGELARALAAQPLTSPAAAEQLAQLFRGQFSVHAEGDSFKVRTATFQEPAAYIAEQLARPEYSHFVRAGNQGGTGRQENQTPHTPSSELPAPPIQPQNMGQAIVLHMQGIKKTEGNPLLDPSMSFGLRRAK